MVPTRDWFQNPLHSMVTKLLGDQTPWRPNSADAPSRIENGIVVLITYTKPPVYLKSFLGYLYYLKQCKCCGKSWKYNINATQIAAVVYKFKFCFSEVYGSLKKNIFNPWSVETMDTESIDMEGQLCSVFLTSVVLFSNLLLVFRYILYIWVLLCMNHCLENVCSDKINLIFICIWI